MSSLVESLAKELGSSMDAVRDAALQRVSSVLSNSTEWDEVEFLKLWKGLFYALWNLDGENEQLLQAEYIADRFLNESLSSQGRCLFWKAFLVTMRNEWIFIDQHRLDKYYALSRRMLRAMFRSALRSKGFEMRFFIDLDAETFSCSGISAGLPSHFAEIYLEEWEIACEAEKATSHDQKTFLCLLHPFVKTLTSPHDHKTRLKSKIRSLVVEPLLKHADEKSETALKAALTLLGLSNSFALPKFSGPFDEVAMKAREALRSVPNSNPPRQSDPSKSKRKRKRSFKKLKENKRL